MTRPRPPTGIRAVLVVARTSSAGGLRGKRLAGLLVLVSLPVLVNALALIFGEGGHGTGMARFLEGVNMNFLGAITPLVVVFLGTAAFGDEWEGGTAPYVVGLPLSRAALVTGRWLAVAARTLLLVVPPLLIIYVLNVVPFDGALAHYLPVLAWVVAAGALLVLGYAAVFLLFGLALRSPVLVSIIYMLVFELLIAHLPPAIAVFSLSYHARNLAWIMTGQKELHPWSFETEPTAAATSVAVLVLATAALLAVATAVLRRKQCTGTVQASGGGSSG